MFFWSIIKVMMKELTDSFVASLEWRAIAFVITGAFMWFVTGNLGQATFVTLVLQLILLCVHAMWLFFRHSR